MPRKSDRKPTVESSIHSKQQQLEQMEEQLKARLNRTKSFLEKVPELKKEVQKKQQCELMERFNRKPTIEGPMNFRLNFDTAKPFVTPKKLRKERGRFPLLTLVLLAIFIAVAYHSWKWIWQH